MWDVSIYVVGKTSKGSNTVYENILQGFYERSFECIETARAVLK